MKKTLCVVLITAMLLSLMPMVVFADTTPTGTAINTLADLKGMKNNGTYYLNADITINEDWNFLPGASGSEWKWENATLDGNGHTIYYADGIKITGGFVREANNITIKNLNIKQLGTATYIGNDNGGEVSALIRRVVGGTINITDVSIYANIVMTSENGANQCGGFVSQANGGTINLTRCVFDGSITKEHTNDGDKKGVAGMIGGCWNSTTYNMTECINYADITSANSAGGFFGCYRGGAWDGNDSRTFKITQCINYGDITVNATVGDQGAGGFIGYYNTNPDSTNDFRYNVNYGKVSATATSVDSYAGGFGGYVRMASGSGYKMYGFVNYGTLNAGKYATNVIAYLNQKGNNTRDNQQNFGYSDDNNKGTAGSNSTLITQTGEELCTLLNENFGAYGASYTTLPNGKITLTWAKQAGYADTTPTELDAVLVAAQLSGNATDETRNIRFVGGLTKTDGLTNVGVLIIAKDAEGKQLKVFEGMTETVYESIYADDEEVFATEYKKDYFFTAVVNNVPTELGAVTFELRTFQIAKNGTLGYSHPKTLTVDLGTLPDSYFRDGWTLSIPAYEGGTLATSTYEAGTGIDKDTGATNLNRAYMMCVSGTTKTEFEAYQNKLESFGYVLDSENTLKGADGENNLYCEYRKENKLIYAYFNSSTKEARIIEDQTSVAESAFEYSFEANASTATEIYMYGMKYSSTGEATNDAVNNGAFYIIKQADNSLILIDGGAALQSTDAAKAGLWSFMKEITGTTKVTVACWFVTHPHEDHFKLAYDVLTANRANIDLQRVMFNFPNPTVTGQGVYEFRGNIDNYFPNVKFLKCHTGQSIHLGGIDIDILMTHEDLVNASTGASTMTEGNSMTTVARFTLPDGTVFLSLGDLDEEQEAPLFSGNNAILHASELKCDIITVAHHGYNKVQATYTAAKAQYALWSNHTSDGFDKGFFGIGASWQYERAQDIIGWLKSANNNTDPETYYAGKNTVKLTCVNGTITATLTDPVY